MGDSAYWLGKIARLRIDRTHGDPAPHKPLLLLVVLDLAEEGHLPKKDLPLSPDLAFRFLSYWTVVAHRRSARPDIRLPFHHLQTDGFWSSLDDSGNPSISKDATRFARLPSDFVRFASDPASRDEARHVLIAKYFRPSERVALYKTVGLPVPSKDEIEQDAAYKSQREAQEAGREIRFRLKVVDAYNYTCALTGYRLLTLTGSLVDAAHIHPFAKSHNNDPNNGIALCKNAHWTFDHGLWTLSDDYRVIVAVGRFTEDNPGGRALTQYHGQLLRLPEDSGSWPSPVHLAWHRKNRFTGY